MVNILHLMVKIARNVTFKMMFFFAALHALVMYFLFMVVGEVDLTANPVSFIYYYVVTSSTIGYGDMSPSTLYGQAIAAFLLIPVAVSLFAALVTKMVNVIVTEISKIYNGYGKMNMKSGHTVIFGYNGEETEKLIAELAHYIPKDKIIVVNDKEDRPFDHDIGFIRTEYFGKKADLERANIKEAANIIVKCADEGHSLHVWVSVVDTCGDNFNGVAYFQNKETADMIENRFKSFETIVSNIAAQISRSVISPGSSQVINNIISKDVDSVLMSYQWTKNHTLRDWSVAEFMRIFAAKGAVLVAVGDKHNSKLMSDFDKTISVEPGQFFYYIAKEPIKEL